MKMHSDLTTKMTSLAEEKEFDVNAVDCIKNVNNIVDLTKSQKSSPAKNAQTLDNEESKHTSKSGVPNKIEVQQPSVHSTKLV